MKLIKLYGLCLLLCLITVNVWAQADSSAYYYRQANLYEEKSKTAYLYAAIAFAVVILIRMIKRYDAKDGEEKKD